MAISPQAKKSPVTSVPKINGTDIAKVIAK